MSLSDHELLKVWEDARDAVTLHDFAHRGWYQVLYAEFIQGRQVLDVGSGLGIDGLTFAQLGAHMTFLDVSRDNLALVERIASILGIRGSRFVHLSDLTVLGTLKPGFDVVMALGSLHHAPQAVIGPEVKALVGLLKPGGRWLQLAYPRSRWLRDGRPPFDVWGQMTDGASTPWAEWYELEKLTALMQPARLDTILSFEFYGGAFNWFDLKLSS